VVFLCAVLNKTKEFILANPNFEIPEKQEKDFLKMLERRKNHEPVAYIVNQKEFFGLNFFINKNVLIPRPETEMLVEETIHNLNCKLNHDHDIDIVDVGTGSGCIITSIAKNVNHTNVNFFATDSSEKSLDVAKKNFKIHGVEFIKALQGNLLEPYLKLRGISRVHHWDRSKTVIIVANLPYLNDDEYESTAPDVKNFEPKSALYGGLDGLKYIKELLFQVSKNGLNKAKIIMEISPSQTQYFTKNFPTAQIKKDLFGIDRFVLLSMSKL